MSQSHPEEEPQERSILSSGPNSITIVSSATEPRVKAILDSLAPGMSQARSFTFAPRVTHLPALRELVTRHGFTPDGQAIAQLRALNNPVAAPAQTPAEKPAPPLVTDGSLFRLRRTGLDALAAVSGRKAERFAQMGIHNVYDLLFTVPRRYIDRSEVVPVTRLAAGEDSCVIGTVSNIRSDPRRRMARISVHDGTGTITATYFNAAWQAKRFTKGQRVIMYGKAELYGATRSWSMVNPLLDPYLDATAPVIPIYPQSGKAGVSTWDLQRAVAETLARIPHLEDPLPPQTRTNLGLLDRFTAVRHIHYPPSLAAADQARERIAFDELFRMQTALLIAKQADAAHQGVAHQPDGHLTSQLVAALPYPLTGAQQRAIDQIRADLAHPWPMHRLLQGDVGSGKTSVACVSLLASVESGHQAALMAPTEILARQLYEEIRHRLDGVHRQDGSPLVVEYFTNRLRGRRRDEALARLADGTIDIAVGTHALISHDIQFSSLGLVIVDEQHRFGVEQRAELRAKGPQEYRPDMLIMTATPIPRTSAMTVFGDLDVTVLDEMPPGRTPVATYWFDEEPDLWQADRDPWRQVRAEVAAGGQAFVVCPLVEESEKMQVASATETYTQLASGALAGLRLGLVHGQQPPAERDPIMEAFRKGDLDVLVATTVIEVGVNVPNATVMVILDSCRFGISQLHQLRGRVGRGEKASHCYLVGRGTSPDSRARMEALVESTDGFYLAEQDLDIRGAGSVFGARQSGESDLKVADLRKDRTILADARRTALALMDEDPRFLGVRMLRAEVDLLLTPEAREWLHRN